MTNPTEERKGRCCNTCWHYDGTWFGCQDRTCKCHTPSNNEEPKEIAALIEEKIKLFDESFITKFGEKRRIFLVPDISDACEFYAIQNITKYVQKFFMDSLSDIAKRAEEMERERILAALENAPAEASTLGLDAVEMDYVREIIQSKSV